MSKIATFPAGLIALTLAACGVAGAATIQGSAPLADRPEGLRCGLVVREEAGRVAIAARVSSTGALTGSYALSIRSAGGAARISQGGDFATRAGQDLTLAETMFSGGTEGLAARFTVTTGEIAHDCPVVSRF